MSEMTPAEFAAVVAIANVVAASSVTCGHEQRLARAVMHLASAVERLQRDRTDLLRMLAEARSSLATVETDRAAAERDFNAMLGDR